MRGKSKYKGGKGKNEKVYKSKGKMSITEHPYKDHSLKHGPKKSFLLEPPLLLPLLDWPHARRSPNERDPLPDQSQEDLSHDGCKQQP